MKKELIFLLAIILMMPIVAKAADKSGSCGEGLSYYFDEANSTLTISGTGSMNNYDPSSSKNSPWYSYRSKIEKVIIEPGVTTIGTSAFYHSVNLKTVIIPNSIEKIYNYAFSNCSSLESIELPPYLSFIAQEAFCKCTSLRSVSIQSVEMIYLDAFKDCNGIQYVNIKNIEDWCKIRFQSQLSNPLIYATHLYLNGTEVKDLVIPNNIISIGSWQFYNCQSLTSVSIPEGVTKIGASAFAGCHNFSTLTIPNSVTNIENSFARCSGLTKIYIGHNLEKMTTSSFEACTSLTDVYCYAEDVPQAGVATFYNSPYRTTVLHVPSGTIDKYKQEEPWKYFKKIVEADVQIYSLKYIIDDKEYVTYNIIEGENIIPVPEPVKEGCTFSGWSEIPETMPSSDVTVTGTFSINKYKLTYMVDGEEYKSNDVARGEAITPEEIPVKEGYTFSGWSEIPETMPANDVTITGSFAINKYKLKYTVDGEEYKSSEVDYGTAITPEEAPVKEGYTFSGWSEIPETMPANDVTITGTFTANKYKLTYMVDGEEYKTYEMEYGSTITPEVAPTKEGYTFSGWSEIPSTMPSSDVTITGTFTVNKYTITYMVGDELLMTEEVEYGSTIAPPKSQKDGYDILWSFYPTTMPAYNITINGTYTTGIDAIAREVSKRQVFTPEGKRIETLQKGLNIMRTSDGKTKKVLVK